MPGIFLDHLEANKNSSFTNDLLLGVAESGGKSELPRLLLLLDEKNLRRDVYDALLRRSGYHQDLDDPELESLHDDRLLSLLQKLTEIGDERLLANVLPKAAKSASSDIEPLLGTLAVFKDNAVRHAAVSAAAWRLKEHGTCAETLRNAIAHEDATTKFLGAEGLALQGHDDGIQVLLTGMDLLVDAEHRQRAVTALGTLANQRALDQLLRLATNEDHALREPAIEAIGHMREGEHAERVFNLLKEACTDYGLQPQALSGLRWFDSPAGWQIIRDAHKDSAWHTRQRVAELLEFDDDARSIEILSSLITDDYDEDVVEAAAKSLRARFGPDSLEPDYIFLQSDEYMLNEFAPDHLARVCEKGDPARLLAIFAKIEEEKQNQIRNPLLAWDTPPAEAAAAALEEEVLQLRKLALSVLGRAAHDPGAARLEELTTRAWEEERRDDELLASLVW
jgi:ParB family chromosome partitioning protein